MPSKRDRALSGLRARRVLKDFMGPKLLASNVLATRSASEIWKKYNYKYVISSKDILNCVFLSKQHFDVH